ncbi:MAG TPA: class I SAM-dependent methyltransferase [Gemmatimonadales bacterium]|nr:class I SAM-dependent methyltransferase [Gemmatimonadales bacterium]
MSAPAFMVPLPEEFHVMARRAAFPVPSLREEWELGNYLSGSTEPWNVEILAALVKASNANVILECGGYLGCTSAWLAMTLQSMGGGTLHVAELEAERAAACDKRLSELPIGEVVWRIWHDDVFRVIAAQPDESLDFAWVDDNHEHDHVARELAALMPKMRRGGLVCGHDVVGSCDLRQEFSKYPNSISLDFPRLGLAGGLGIIQVE